jgi:hypothetical protein
MIQKVKSFLEIADGSAVLEKRNRELLANNEKIQS